MGLGSKLSDLMEQSGTNANELARRVGVSPQTIYSIIKRDNKKIDIEVLLKISNIFGVKAEYFVDEQDSPQTLAAHFDGTEFSEDELDEIKQFAEFVKNRKK